MSSSVNESNLEKKFLAVTNTQDSIQTLSLWILHHRAHHKKIVDIWMKVLKKSKINHRLTLFYLANDVVQNGKRKGYPQFGEAFSEVLREATLLVRSEKIRSSVERVFNIWEQRNVYGASFISELQAILVNSKVPKTAPSKLLAEFKHENVIKKIREVLTLEIDTAAKSSSLNISKLDATKAEILQQLKDRTHGQRFSCDFDEATSCLEDVIQCLEKEVKNRTQLVLLLEESEIFYDTQRGEAKVVANAYKNFGSKIKALQKKLEELKASFPSPVPSPCLDAPSPANSDPEADTVLPNPKTKSEPDDSDSLGNVPSPEGSPEGLALTPPPSEKATQENSVGNPIPTLSNFFPQTSSVMASWFETFSSSSKNSTPVINSPTPDTKKADPSSLDSRLSNMMQNIPHLPSGLQSSLFGGSSSGGLSPVRDVSSPPPYRKDETSARGMREITPVKDECSGQNTPLQDEDIQSSNHSGFFNPPATSSKTSQNSKDVLKGLTNLIQTVTSAKAEKPDYDPKQNISDFIKKIAPQLDLSPHSPSSPMAFLNSPPNTFVSQPKENAHSSPRPARITSPNPSRSFSNSSYSPSQMDPYSGSTSSPSKAMHENLSFIPTLVPSTPHDGGFDFTADNFPADEYNPESENYLPIENSDDLCPVSTPSPTLLDEACESPDDLSEEDDIPSNLSNRRQSTLITLVAEEKTPTPTVDRGSSSSEDSMAPPGDTEYLSPHQDILQGTNVMQNPVGETWPPVNMQVGEQEGLVHLQENLTVPEPVLPSQTFVGDHDERQNLFSPMVPPPIPESGPLNGGCETSFPPPVNLDTTLVSYPLSKIETVQSHRNDMDNNRWFGNDWGGGFHGQRQNQFHTNEQRPNFNRRPYEQRDFQFRRGGPHSNFRPRSNWQPRRFNEHEQGPPHPKRFAPFPGRGRGWRNNYHQQ